MAPLAATFAGRFEAFRSCVMSEGLQHLFFSGFEPVVSVQAIPGIDVDGIKFRSWLIMSVGLELRGPE